MGNVFGLPPKIILLDTEYTCWEGSLESNWSAPNEYKEIVQIGALKVDCDKLSELGAFGVFIKPVKNPFLSRYFIKLTGITQQMVDSAGVDLKSALKKFLSWSNGLRFYSFGQDMDVIENNCRMVEVPFPFGRGRFYDIREVFVKFGVDVNQFTSGTIVKAFGKTIKRPPHNALNDMRTLLEGLRELAKYEI